MLYSLVTLLMFLKYTLKNPNKTVLIWVSNSRYNFRENATSTNFFVTKIDPENTITSLKIPMAIFCSNSEKNQHN